MRATFIPLTILSTLPSAGVGALLALELYQMDFSLVALIGVVLLIGIVKKNAIMMIDFALEAQRERGLVSLRRDLRGLPASVSSNHDDHRSGPLGRVAHGAETGTGSELRRPLGVAIVGGLLLSQFLTLYTTPVIYLALDRVERWISHRRGASQPVGPASARLPNERFRSIYPAPDWHVAARHRLVAAWRHGVFLSARCALAAGGLSDHWRERVTSWRRSGDRGQFVGRPVGATSRTDRWSDGDDVGQLAGRSQCHHAVRLESKRERRRARRASGDQCRRATISPTTCPARQPIASITRPMPQ